MQHTILELEEGTLTLSVADVGPKGILVQHCKRLAIGNLQGDSLAAALRGLQADLPAAMAHVHVLLGERRCQHFTLAVPRLPAAELHGLVVREALRVAGQPVETEMLTRVRVLKRLPRGRFQLAVTAVAAAVWEPLQRCLSGLGIEVASLATVEDGLGLAIDPTLPPRTAVVECSGGRARFVVCERGAPTQVRRFMVSGSDNGEDQAPAVLGAQLAMEVPRTLDYLREVGQARPEALMLSRRIGLGEDDLEVFAEQGMRCALTRADWRLAEDQDQPGLATIGRLRAMRGGRPLASLATACHVHLPMSRALCLAAAGIVLTGMFGAGLGIAELGRLDGARLELRQLQADTARLDRAAAASTVHADAAADQLLVAKVLGMRRPCSLLLAEISNAVPANCELQRVEFDSATGVTVAGRAIEASRREALAALRRFADGLRQIPCVVSKGREEIDELEGAAGRLRFCYALRWRRS